MSLVRFYKLLSSFFGLYPESDLLSPSPLTTWFQVTIILLWIYWNNLLTGLISFLVLLDFILSLEAKVILWKFKLHHVSPLIKTLQWYYFLSEKKWKFLQWSPRLFKIWGPLHSDLPLYHDSHLTRAALTVLVCSDNPSQLPGCWPLALSVLISLLDSLYSSNSL